MITIKDLNHAAQQQAAKQGTQLANLLPALDGAMLELAQSMLMFINVRNLQEKRADAAEKRAYAAEHLVETLQIEIDAQ